MVNKDFGQFDISDINSPTAGRVMVDLRNVKPNPMSFGFAIGYKIPVTKKITLFNEFHIRRPVIINIGMDFNFIQKTNFTLGLTAKIGAFDGRVKLGRVKSSPGFDKAYLRSGYVYPEDKINLRYGGFVFGIGLSPKFKINSNLSLMGFVGLNESFITDNYLEFPDNIERGGGYSLFGDPTTLRFDEDITLKSDGTKTPSGLNPKVKPLGIVFNIGISYRIGRKD